MYVPGATDRQRQADRQTDRQTGRPTDKQTDIQKDRRTDSSTHLWILEQSEARANHAREPLFFLHHLLRPGPRPRRREPAAASVQPPSAGIALHETQVARRERLVVPPSANARLADLLGSQVVPVGYTAFLFFIFCFSVGAKADGKQEGDKNGERG